MASAGASLSLGSGAVSGFDAGGGGKGEDGEEEEDENARRVEEEGCGRRKQELAAAPDTTRLGANDVEATAASDSDGTALVCRQRGAEQSRRGSRLAKGIRTAVGWNRCARNLMVKNKAFLGGGKIPHLKRL